jgi:hypothetical protein
MLKCAQKRKGVLVRKEIANIGTMILEDSTNKDIESIVSCMWNEISQKNLPSMLEDMESLKYVPVETRRIAASEPLFLVRY